MIEPTTFPPAGTESFSETSSKEDNSKTCLKKETNNELASSALYDRVCQWIRNTLTTIDQEGATFRAALTTEDIRVMKLARFFFHSCSIAAPLLYYMGTVERPCKFPATISFTIRKGPPKHAQMLIWGLGWALMGKIIRRRGSKILQNFCANMFLTGIWTTILFRLGRDKLSDVCHFFGAGVYMFDHVILLRILNTRPVFRKLFYASFALLVASIGGTRAVEMVCGLPTESDSKTSTADRARRVERLPMSLRRKLFYWELLVMVSENMLFSSFVQGMPSGLRDVDGEDSNQKEDDDNSISD